MEILVLGHKGMLGREVVEAGRRCEHQMIYSGGYDIVTSAGLVLANREIEPDAVINCAGIIPAKCGDNVGMLLVNAVGPHNVAKHFPGVHIVQVSTDCVFGGRDRGPHAVYKHPDPDSLYGRSKLAGELTGPYHTTVRTSFIGYDHGLLPWFLSQTGVVDGWYNAMWSGSTVYEVARKLVDIACNGPAGLVHLATKKAISKCDVLHLLKRGFDLELPKIRHSEYPMIFRDLKPTHLLEPFDTAMVAELVKRRPWPM